MSFIRGYQDGANISLLNVIYHKPVKNENGKYVYVNGTVGGVKKSCWGGGEYWVPYNAFMAAFQQRAAFKPKNVRK